MRGNFDKPNSGTQQDGTPTDRRVRTVKDRSFATVHLPDQHKRPTGRVGAAGRTCRSLKVIPPRILPPERATPVDQAPHMPASRASSYDRHLSGLRLDQYYTKPQLARQLYLVFQEYFDPRALQMVEPSAGAGSFSSLLPFGSLAYDIAPAAPGILKADFLTTVIESDRPIAVIGNPPFGRNCSLAVRFFNHAAKQADVIAMILPKTFRKTSILNRLDRSFHLLREVEVPPDAFLFGSRTVTVSTVFQIWVRRPTPRRLLQVRTTHPDFEFTDAAHAQFAIQRIGARAGRLHHDLTASKSSHYTKARRP